MVRPSGAVVAIPAFAVLLLSSPAMAQIGSPKPIEPLSASSVASVFFALLLVLAMLFAAAWLLKRLQRVQQPAQGAAIQIVSQLQLGMKERVMLLRVGDQNLLIGCTPGNLRSLHVWSGELPEKAETPSQPLFIDHIKALLAERKKS